MGGIEEAKGQQMFDIGDSPFPGPEQEPRPRAHPTVTVISITVMVVAVAVVVVILANPFSQKAQEIRNTQLKIEAAEKEMQVIEEKRVDKYTELETKIDPLLKSAQEKLDGFKATAKRLFADVEAVAHRSLEQLTSEPPNVPKEIVDATRFNEDFRRPWNELLNAYTGSKDVRETELIRVINRKREERQLVESDYDALSELIDSLDRAQAKLTAQRTNLDSVRRILAQRELDALSTKSERSSP